MENRTSGCRCTAEMPLRSTKTLSPSVAMRRNLESRPLATRSPARRTQKPDDAAPARTDAVYRGWLLEAPSQRLPAHFLPVARAHGPPRGAARRLGGRPAVRDGGDGAPAGRAGAAARRRCGTSTHCCCGVAGACRGRSCVRATRSWCPRMLPRARAWRARPTGCGTARSLRD
jgi:hypothetical protein